LEYYAQFLKPDGLIHLKTDSAELHAFTKEVVRQNELPVMECCADIYGTGYADEVLSIKTHYEEIFLAEGKPITYITFSLGGKNTFSVECDE
jgi:tRNA (guanine-N7-)-methyltransferase